MRLGAVLGLILGLGVPACREAMPQRTMDVTCDSCRIRLEYVSTLGTADGPGAMSAYPNIKRDSRGRYYAATWRAEPAFVYDSNGAFLQRLGKEGDGPGEFRWPIQVVVAPGDTLHVIDQVTGRITVLDPAYRYVRSAVGVPPAYDAVWLGHGVIAIDYRRGAEPSIRLFGPDASELARFGKGPPLCARCGGGFLHRLSVDSDGSLLAVKINYEYEITRWDRNGQLLDRWLPTSAWFTPYASVRSPGPDQPPQSSLWGVWRGVDGLLWTVGTTAAAGWRDAVGAERRSPEGVLYYPIEDQSKAYDGIVEAIDPSTTTVVQRQIIPGAYALQVIEPDLIGSARIDADGWYFVDIYRVHLDGYGDVEGGD